MQHENAWDVVGSILGKDIGVEGSVWRWGPVTTTFNSQTITSSGNVFYHAKVGFTQFGGLVSCGYGEPARVMNITLSAHVVPQPDWSLGIVPVVNVAALNPCQITFVGVDVTNRVRGLAERGLQGTAVKERDRVLAMTKFRDRAETTWKVLNTPIAVGSNAWLSIQPIAAGVGDLALSDSQQYLSVPVVLDARPEIYVGVSPPGGASPLPNLVIGSANPKFEVQLRALVDYVAMTNALRKALIGRSYGLGEKFPYSLASFKISDVSIYGNGDFLVLKVVVSGGANGPIYFVGKPRFVTHDSGPTRAEIVFDDVDYTAESTKALIRAGDVILHSPVRDLIRSAAHIDVSTQFESAQSGLVKAINGPISPSVTLKGNLDKPGPGGIWIGPDQAEAYLEATGRLDVIIAPF